MKIFKKVISMVLVVAMLASFAGMTGYVPSIVADAADALTSTTAPVDTKSGINQATIDMPPVLYTNSSGVIINSISSSSGTTALDTTLNITLPSGVTSATLKAVDYNSDSTVYGSWTLSAGSNTVDFNGQTGSTITGGYPYLCLRLDYTMTVTHTPYNTPTGSIVDSTYEQASSLTNNPYLDDTYGDKSVADTVSVTYTQYIAAYITSLPRYYQVGWQFDLATKYTADQSLAGVIMLDMAPALATNGINLYGALRVGASDNHSNAALRNYLESRGNLGLSTTQNNALIWYNSEQKTNCGVDNGVYTSGEFSRSGANSSNRTLGGTIYYDPYNVSSTNINMKYDFTASNESTSDENGFDGFWLTWYNSGVTRAGYEVTEDGVAGTYLGDGITSHSNDNASDSGGLASYSSNGYTVFTKTGGTYPNSGMNFTSSDTTVNFSFNLANATASGNPYWRCVQQLNRPTAAWALNKTNLRAIWGFHLDAIAVDRSAEHAVINAAISKNFVEAEMDATWWKEYRDEVLFAYFDCGDLQNVVGVKGLFDNCIANGYASNAPVYKVANYTDLGNAILNTPDYDRGNNERVTDATRIQPGAGHVSVINYASDPIGKTYGDYAGNGVNNLIDASIYRYSGAYFYTEDSWRTYATERYYAVNIFEYYNSTVPYQCFWYGSGVDTANKVSQTSYCYYQSTIDEATARLTNAYNALELRKLDTIKMRNDYDGDGAWVYDSSGNQVVGYDAIIAYLESLIDKSTVKYYKGLKDTDGDGIKDTLEEATMQLYDTTALEEKLAAIKSTYSATDTVVDKGIAFEAAIADFLKEVDNTKNNKKTATSFAGWNALFTQLTEMAGGSTTITTGNILDKFSELYIDDANGTVYSAIETVINNYNAFTESDTGYALNDQEELNGYVEDLYTALCTALPSVAVNNAATDAKAYPATQTFKVYDYQIGESDHAPADVIQFTDDSITKLNNAADAAAAVTYPMLTTPVSTLTSAAATVTAMAALEADGGLLVNRPAVTDYLTIAADNAKTALYGSTTGTTGKTTTVTSPDGSESKTVSLYTAQSVAELEYVLNQAAAKLEEVKAGTKLWSAQLEIDQLTYALYEETTDDTPYLLGGMASAFGDYRTWTYADGVITAGELIWTPDAWNTLLYSTRGSAYKGSEKYGLQYDGAYYGFLDAEIVAPHTNDEGNRDDNYTVWNEDGSLVTVTAADGSTAYAGATVFTPETWGAYIAAYNTAKAVSRDLTLADQATVDNAAKALYDARNALQYNYFPSNKEGFEAAKALYANLEAYLVTTPITRYGYTIDAETGALVEATALDTCQVNVNIYSNITPEFENAIVAFEAKYASDTSTEPFDSLAAAQELYDSIIATYVNSETAPIALKKTDDSSFYAGMQDLVDNYIAGDWDGTAYTSDLLNGTQVDKLNESLADAEAIFTSESTVVDSTLGVHIAAQTKIVFEYTTTTNAYDLQFATYMKDNELYPFLDYSYIGDVPYYYDDDKDGVGSYTYKLFDDDVVNQIKTSVDGLFVVNGDTTTTANAANWPCIYEVNGLTWNKEAVNEEGAYVEAVVDGYEYVDGAYTGAYDSICKILSAVASHSANYVTAIKNGVNAYNSAPYFWLIDNAFKVDGDVEYILGDVSAVRTDTTAAPFNYDVSLDEENMIGWYSAGYGVDGGMYYLYNDSAADGFQSSWFINENGAMDTIAMYRSDDMAYSLYKTTLKELRNLSPVDYYNGYIAQCKEADPENADAYLKILDDLTQNGWTKSGFENFANYVIAGQSQFDGFAIDMYYQIQSLQLRPATEAYRDVYLTYLGVKGSSATFSFDADKYKDYVGTETTVDFYTFYNMAEDTFLNQFTGETTYPDVVPPYGTVSKADHDLWAHYKTVDEYAADETNYMQLLEEFIAELKKGTVTVDKAAEVNLYDLEDGVDSEMEKLIDILSNLKLKDRDTRWLDALVTAFLGDTLSTLTSSETTALFAIKGLTIVSDNGGFYETKYYTEESLIALAVALTNAKVIKNVVEYDTTEGKYKFVSDFSFGVADISPYKDEFYNNATQEELDEYVQNTLLPAICNDLVLAPASTTAIDNVLAVDKTTGAAAAYANPNLYVQNDAWTEFVAAYDAAITAKGKCDVTIEGYYTAAKDQATVDGFATTLADKLALLTKVADSAAPKMTVSASDSDVAKFYNSDAVAEDDTVTNAQQIAAVDPTGAANPVTGTFFMPNNGGYSLLVYTNEVSPRIVLEMEDIMDANGIEATKHETISVKSSRTSGTTTELIYGTKNGNGVITEIFSRNLKGNPLGSYTNTAPDSADSTKNEDGSSVFAVLAPTFVANSNGIAVAIYSISVRDAAASGDDVSVGTADNYTASLNINEIDVGVTTSTDNMITVYIYYHNSMNDDTDEGITADGALATPSVETVDHVASVLLSGEPNYQGAWRGAVGFHRQFSGNIRSWEFMSEITDNKVGSVENVVYNDPTFGDKNLGSFYYVLDETTDADIYSAYYTDSNDATDGVMDYAMATVAKDAMISNINAKTADEITAFKASSNFHVYGAVDAAGEYVNYIQHLTNITDNGDLVFVHVVDRWGNVVNRIVEITRLDKNKPALTPNDTAHTITIVEEGGSGLNGIQISNTSYSEGSVDLTNYSIAESSGQNVTTRENGSMQVNCAGNKLQISGLTPGRLYYFAVTDKAGNYSGANVNADANGNVTIIVETNTVVSDSDEAIATNSITLNGTDTIILNSGEASSVIDASLEGNVFANRAIRHVVTTYDNVTQLKTVYQDGTVEEWTADNATVTDNGDGTLTWVIKRTLAEGEHNYKVYAMVDGEYESFYAPATITATTKSVKITYRVIGMGKTVLNYSGSIAIKNSTYNSLTVPYGSEVTITADTNVEGCEFYYWINNYTERIISTANVYAFKAVTNVDYIAQFTNSATYYDGKKLVVYVNNAKNVIERFELAEGDTYTVPAGPVLPDYTFKGWSMTQEEVLASDKDTVIVEPIYTLSAENTVTITQGNYTATGAGTYTAEENQRAVVTVSVSATDNDGNQFLYWLDDDTDEIVSYDRTYSFFCVKDTVLTPVYGDASTIEVAPVVRITEVRYSALSGKVSFFAERSVPEEFTLLQTGIVVTKTESIGTNDEVFVVGGTSTAAGTSTSTANNGYYSASTAISTGQTVWARAYAIYETADGEILEAYGPVTSYTVE